MRLIVQRYVANVEVDIFGQWVAGEIAREPLFDPKGERVRGPAG